ncbi:nickel-dependent lactate racemase [Sutterella sp.]|uniref:nickel-dependent lactate racemase n=1 Tax=Sutterella sp. TaxID=1981025 RepID=UPI0026DF31C4|nr:nickel-dependent lactate racemase [Sutterella sp.]MDO5531451.1 nickel-dependent lactate racemase [Sutterella sp.]
MALTTYDFAYGSTRKTFDFESDDILKVVRTEPCELMDDVKAKTLEALYHPIGLPPINEIVKPGDTVAFICNDPTRIANSEIFMPILVDEMNKLGVPDENMRIVFALGTHRAMTQEEMEKEVSPEVARRIAMHNSIATNADDFQYFGDTSFGTPVWINKLLCDVDHVFLTGTIVHHYFSGYGGGRKAVLPGCAAMETVRCNHSHMLSDEAGLGRMEGNPCYDDQMEGVALFAKGRSLFLFNAILNAKHEFLRIFAGDYIKAHKEACKFVDRVYGCVIPREADLVIASCGGYPKDINVYQMQKTMDNAACAVRKGGVVILLAECIEGSGSAKLEETFRRLTTPEAIKADLEANFQIGANKAYAITRPIGKARFILVTALNRDLAKSMHFTAAVDTVEEAIAIAKQYVGEHPATILMPEGSLTVPRVEEPAKCCCGGEGHHEHHEGHCCGGH